MDVYAILSFCDQDASQNIICEITKNKLEYVKNILNDKSSVYAWVHAAEQFQCLVFPELQSISLMELVPLWRGPSLNVRNISYKHDMLTIL